MAPVKSKKGKTSTKPDKRGKKDAEPIVDAPPLVEEVKPVEPVDKPKRTKKKARDEDMIPEGTFVLYYEKPTEQKAGVLDDDDAPRQRAVFMNEDHSGFIYYPNGKIALALTKTSAGFICYVYSSKGMQLASFDAAACGSAMYPDGHLWFLTTAKGVQVLEKDGRVKTDILWDNAHSMQPIELKLSPSFSLVCNSRHDMTIAFRCRGVSHDIQVGQMLSRTDTYMDNVTFGKGENRGKANVNISRVRERQARQAADEEARKAPKKSSEFKHSELGAIVDLLGTIKVDKGTGRLTPDIGSPSSPVPPRPASTLGDTTTSVDGRESAAGGNLDGTSSSPSKVLPPSGRYVAGKVKKSTRKRLVLISSKNYDTVLASKKYTDKIVMVACLADWANTMKLERVLEAVNGDLARTHPDCRMLKHDLAESRTIQERYRFRQPPMFFVYYNSKLVFARDTCANYGTTKADIVQLFTDCEKNVKAGQFLPESFVFGANDNNLADTISRRLENNLSATRLPQQVSQLPPSRSNASLVTTTVTTTSGRG